MKSFRWSRSNVTMSSAVVAPKKVRFADEEMSLTAATRQVLGLDYSVQPGPHWTYEGKSIRDLYEETYGDTE